MATTDSETEVEPIEPKAAHSRVMGLYLLFATIARKYPVNDELSPVEIKKAVAKIASKVYLNYPDHAMPLLERTADTVYVIATHMRDNGIGTSRNHGRRQRVALEAVLQALGWAKVGLKPYHDLHPDELPDIAGRIFETDWVELAREIMPALPDRDPNEPDKLG